MFKNIIKFKIYKLYDFKLIKTNYYLNFTRKAKKDITIADGLEIIKKKIEKLDGSTTVTATEVNSVQTASII